MIEAQGFTALALTSNTFSEPFHPNLSSRKIVPNKYRFTLSFFRNFQ